MNEFERMGGRQTLINVSKCFYDKVYADPWLGLYFKDVSQDVIEIQQVDFMQTSLGGGKVYCGALPIPAHKHMFITQELFDYRHQLLLEAFEECSISDELKNRWIKIEKAFERRLVKSSLEECEKRFPSDEVLAYEHPYKLKIPA